MFFVMAIISQKGGVGKSTLAVHLAAEASHRGHKTLLIDVDPQASALGWANRRGERPPDVASPNAAVITREVERARTALYDLVIIDTAPHADHAALQAARVADLVAIPCRPSTFDLDAITTTMDLCRLAKKPARVILNAAPIRSRVVAEAEAAIARQSAVVSPVIIRQRVAYQHCMIDGRTAGEFEPGGAAAREITRLLADLTPIPVLRKVA